MSIPQSNLGGNAAPDFWAGRKVTATHKALLWQGCHDAPPCPSRLVLQAIAETPPPLAITLRHIHRLRKAWGLNRGQGRPRRVDDPKKSGAAGAPRPCHACS